MDASDVAGDLKEVLIPEDEIAARVRELAAELDPRRTNQEEILRHAMPR